MNGTETFYCTVSDHPGRMYSLPLFYTGNSGSGRMLSPDNYVQDPNNPNNYNRYAYCMNNPLKYTDPSGEFFLGTIFTYTVDFISTAFFKGDLM